MTVSQSVLARLWWGVGRQPFESLARRWVRKQANILAGPLRGAYFAGGISQMLGIYEIQVQEEIIGSLKPGQVFYDLGANNGFFSLLGSKQVGSSGRVYAFEPFSTNGEKIRLLLEKNRLENVTLIPQAVSQGIGRADLFIGPDPARPSLWTQAGNLSESVTTITLDAFIGQNRWPDLIKVDVEGAEDLVLKGAPHLLRSQQAPRWILEIHSPEKERSVQGMLTPNGYIARPIYRLGRRFNPYPCYLVAEKR